ncbi:MAG: response regulator transcription factor [Dehalococcoidia bacterium]
MRGIRTYLELEDQFTIVGEASNGREAAERVPAYRPDVVLMDLLMPEMDGIAATKAIKEANPEVKVIVLTSFTDDQHIMPAIEAEATGYTCSRTCRPRTSPGTSSTRGRPAQQVTRRLMEQVRQPRRAVERPGEISPRANSRCCG